MSLCKYCEARVRWVRHERSGAAMILDYWPAPRGTGTVLVVKNKARIVQPINRDPNVVYYQVHQQTCPKAAEWRADREKRQLERARKEREAEAAKNRPAPDPQLDLFGVDR